MYSRKQYICYLFFFMLLLSPCLFVSGCTRSISKSELLNLSENAVFYEYSVDNFLSLESVIVDSESHDNRIIFQFDDDSEYLSQNVIESLIDRRTKYPDRIEGDSVNHERNTKVESVFDNGSIYIVLNFDPNIECSYLYIIYGYLIEVQGPWDGPRIELIEYGCSKDGKEGDFVYSQTYNKDRQKWNECEESFIEYPPIGLD